MPDLNELARIGYEAYAAHQGWTAYNGTTIPAWDGVREDIKSAWEEAALAIMEAAV